MKVRVTRKEVLLHYTNVINVGYCDLQWLLKNREANFYTTGVYGWNADIYEIDHDTAIVTGYRPFGNIRPIHEIVKAFDGTARVCHDMDMSRQQRQCLLEQLITAFISKVVR